MKETDLPDEAEIKLLLDRELKRVRIIRKPNVRGVMLLTSHIAGLMMTYGSMSQDKLDALELIFWITHNGDGTLITREVRSS